ncbi:MAG TPA: hypothetical protein VFH06_04125 [Candidatus Saccharimonadales bacterium]|nr:hypothetical protein [Candidatus Saccharimonadales bacterium]
MESGREQTLDTHQLPDPHDHSRSRDLLEQGGPGLVLAEPGTAVDRVKRGVRHGNDDATENLGRQHPCLHQSGLLHLSVPTPVGRNGSPLPRRDEVARRDRVLLDELARDSVKNLHVAGLASAGQSAHHSLLFLSTSLGSCSLGRIISTLLA